MSLINPEKMNIPELRSPYDEKELLEEAYRSGRKPSDEEAEIWIGIFLGIEIFVGL